MAFGGIFSKKSKNQLYGLLTSLAWNVLKNVPAKPQIIWRDLICHPLRFTRMFTRILLLPIITTYDYLLLPMIAQC